MHPGDYSGHVIDLGVELTNVNATQTLSTSKNSETDEVNDDEIFSTNANKIPIVNDQSYQQVNIRQETIKRRKEKKNKRNLIFF